MKFSKSFKILCSVFMSILLRERGQVCMILMRLILNNSQLIISGLINRRAVINKSLVDSHQLLANTKVRSDLDKIKDYHYNNLLLTLREGIGFF